MKLTGGCYCGALRYEFDGQPMFQAQCHCRECQYISGGHPNVVFGVPDSGFIYVKGAPKGFTRADLEAPVTREFCAECGTHILAKNKARPGMLILKIGTLDDPSLFTGPQMAIFLKDKQSFHSVPEGIPTFETAPG